MGRKKRFLDLIPPGEGAGGQWTEALLPEAALHSVLGMLKQNVPERAPPRRRAASRGHSGRQEKTVREAL